MANKTENTTKESVMANTKTETKTEPKIPYKYGETMVADGYITQSELDDMVANGKVANPNGGNRGNGSQAMIGSDKKTHIFPTLYFKGVGKLAYTDKMNELRKKFNELKNEYTSSPIELVGS